MLGHIVGRRRWTLVNARSKVWARLNHLVHVVHGGHDRIRKSRHPFCRESRVIVANRTGHGQVFHPFEHFKLSGVLLLKQKPLLHKIINCWINSRHQRVAQTNEKEVKHIDLFCVRVEQVLSAKNALSHIRVEIDQKMK